MKTVIALAVALALSPLAHAQTAGADNRANPTNRTADAKKMDRQTEEFFKEGAMGGMAEVELGQLAAQQAANADVKAFGQMMVKDHTGANEKLKALAQAHGVALPTELDGKHKRAKEKLSKRQGADFDKAYMGRMVKDHKSTIDLFEDTAKKSDVADVKAFAEGTLPTLREHLKLAQQLEDTVKKSK
jgi:putative membrane protein